MLPSFTYDEILRWGSELSLPLCKFSGILDWQIT